MQVLEAVNEEVARLIRLAGTPSHSTALQKDVELQVISGSSITKRADEDLILQFLLNFSTTRSNIRRLAVT